MPRRKNKPRKRNRGSADGPSKKSKSSANGFNGSKFQVEVVPNLSHIPYKFGTIVVTSHELHDYVVSNTFTVKFEPESTYCCISWEDEKNEVQVTTLTATCETPFDILQNLCTIKMFYFIVHSQVLHQGENIVEIYMHPSSFITLKSASEPFFNHQKKKMFRLLQFFFNVEFDVEKKQDFLEREFNAQASLKQGSVSSDKLSWVFLFFPLKSPTDELEYEENYLYDEEQVEKIYNAIQNHYDPNSSDTSVSHEYLIPELRLYQSQAVQWMLRRENPIHKEDLHVLYTVLHTQDGEKIYFHKYGGFFVHQKYTSEEPCKGGILADEMGLGKTLEVLACILLNPRRNLEVYAKNIPDNLSFNNNRIPNQNKNRTLSFSDDDTLEYNLDLQHVEYFECVCGCLESSEFIDKPSVSCGKCGGVHHTECVLFDPNHIPGDYICPYCWINNFDPVSSRATLIISPASIIDQWESEISRHIKKDCLKVFMYKGVDHQKFIEPRYLADHDIVLTSYETLRKELNYVDLPHGKNRHSLRHPKKFMAIPSPMCNIEWWRICLDEAQMVESVTSKIAKMTGKLHCINRWCVTGTPIKKSVEDLYGLLLFLEAKPYNEKLWWKEVIWKPFVNGDISNISPVLKEIAWRTAKQQVLDQIQLPELEDVSHKLDFVPLERVHYERKHTFCKRKFFEKIERFESLDISLNALDKHVLSKVMLPLRHLQVACCVCRVQRGGHSFTMTPTELLNHMLKTAKYECEDVHRKLIMAMNGLAGIHNIQENFQAAVETYEKALKSIVDNKMNFRTDLTQTVHSLFHLSNVLSMSKRIGRNVQSSYTSSDLNDKVNIISIEYMEKGRFAVMNCKKPVEKVSNEIDLIIRKFHFRQPSQPHSVWWLVMFQHQTDAQKEHLMLLLNEHLRCAPGKTFLRNEGYFNDSIMKIQSWEFLSKICDMIKDLHKARTELKKCMELVSSVSTEPTSYFFNSAISCHLRPVPSSEKCIYCQADDLFKVYETKLFRFDETAPAPSEEENICFSALRRGTHAESDLEIILKCILMYARRKDHYEPPNCLEDGANHIKLLDAFKKEFKCLRSLWLKCSEYVSQKDELEMAKISTRLISPSERQPNPPVPYILHPYELQPKKVQYESDVLSLQYELNKKLGHFFYLQNLEKAKSQDSPFEEVCPICRQKIDISWSVLQCGHNFCLVCMDRLLNSQTSFMNPLGVSCTGIHCPVCRQFNSRSDVYFIDKGKAADQLEIQGSHSTKVGAVVMCLLNISKNDSTAKALVFSSFIDFLYALEDALTENDIKCFNFCRKKYFKDYLKEFKEGTDCNILLIPLNFGCSGLNITEATHVLLTEPVLDDSKHLQAIGRIHRIGQTKKTTVHRFFIQSTIEENIYNIQKMGVNDDNTCRKLTLGDVKDVFQEC